MIDCAATCTMCTLSLATCSVVMKDAQWHMMIQEAVATMNASSMG